MSILSKIKAIRPSMGLSKATFGSAKFPKTKAVTIGKVKASKGLSTKLASIRALKTPKMAKMPKAKTSILRKAIQKSIAVK